jgi:hypothetical protein
MTGTEGQEEPAEVLEFTRHERAYLIDAVMVLMHQMEQVQQHPRELPELQRLLGRLMDVQLPPSEDVPS